MDIIQISRMESVLKRWQDRFVLRVFTEDEAALCRGKAFPPSAFALRFAAKEAFSKALGLGMRKGVRWRDIEVFHFPGGRPGLRLFGRTLEICEKNNIHHSHISLSDEGDYGVAMVVLEKA